MNNYVIETKVKNGKVILENLPFKDEIDVNVVLIPKMKFNQFSFKKIREITKGIRKSLANEIIAERRGNK